MISAERTSGLDGPQKDQVVWWGYLNPKSGSPASILGSVTILFSPFHVSYGTYGILFSSIFVGCIFKECYTFLSFVVFSLPFCNVLVGTSQGFR